MATAGDLRSRVTDLVTCPICLELFNSPKSLPCLHTFCLQCIEGHCRDNEPGDTLQCPVCRHAFTIPENGVQELISNFFIAELVEARKTARDVALVEAEPIQQEIKECGKCDKHTNDDVKLYCLDCNKNLCVICFAEEHQQHKCKNVTTVAAETVSQIDFNLTIIQERAKEAQKEVRRLDYEKKVFIDGANGVEKRIIDQGEALKQLIDKQVNELLQEVRSLKSEICKKMDSCMDNIEITLVAFETFSAYCRELTAKGKPSDITRAANGLHTRADELTRSDVTQTNIRVPHVSFEPKNMQEILAGGHSLIGELTVQAESEDITDYMFKIVLFGVDGAAGKSSIMRRFLTNEFTLFTNVTIGVGFGEKTINVGCASIKLAIWDLAEKEHFARMRQIYLRDAAGALLVYDITRGDSIENFSAISRCLADIRSASSPNVVNVLVGNKVDLDAQRSVTFLEGKQFAEENDLLFLETSALTGENIEEAFLMCVRGILANIATGKIDPEDERSGVHVTKRATTAPNAARPATKESCSCS